MVPGSNPNTSKFSVGGKHVVRATIYLLYNSASANCYISTEHLYLRPVRATEKAEWARRLMDLWRNINMIPIITIISGGHVNWEMAENFHVVPFLILEISKSVNFNTPKTVKLFKRNRYWKIKCYIFMYKQHIGSIWRIHVFRERREGQWREFKMGGGSYTFHTLYIWTELT